jgi:hypothetical protein
MKRFLMIVAVLVCAVSVFADTATISVTVTNGQAATLSSAIPASGEIDKIEFVQDSAATSTVVVATYTGTTAIETLASLSAWATSTKLVIPRRVGTTTAGVSLTAAAIAGSDATTNTTGTALIAAYERPVIGGNIKMSVTGTENDGTNTVTATIYYRQLQK